MQAFSLRRTCVFLEISLRCQKINDGHYNTFCFSPDILTIEMDSVVLQAVTKIFRHSPALFNWMGRERGGETRALDQISVAASSAQILVLLGPNGSGKTTILKLISTMLIPDEGHVMVGGADTQTDPQQARRQVGFAVSGERSFFPRLSARENLDFYAALDDVRLPERRRRIELMLQQTGLLDAADTLVMKFSSGMYQRLGIARALIKQPSVILLDEPTRSLDPASATHFWNLVRSLSDGGTTVILATHSLLEAAAVGDFAAVLRQGRLAGYRKIAATDPEELRSFYFHTTGEVDERSLLTAGSWR
jgi:ABC-2 type transport system ATP-binding protein